ncbi:hypothetical protein WICPIJ_005252 [Wickerhamomyces pijperi]|uniref:Uncharacterized protein n=1 Tax=Wickerhamomyces pijperi TaxID=599730 RepID=A0A9P8Q3Y2_WICPI|nr:hypothetical protein WICPIJ_005252 [Wickerhamomyces pijperi]
MSEIKNQAMATGTNVLPILSKTVISTSLPLSIAMLKDSFHLSFLLVLVLAFSSSSILMVMYDSVFLENMLDAIWSTSLIELMSMVKVPANSFLLNLTLSKDSSF